MMNNKGINTFCVRINLKKNRKKTHRTRHSTKSKFNLTQKTVTYNKSQRGSRELWTILRGLKHH